MATIVDRSRLTVSVKHRADLTRTFPYDASKRARAYLEELRAQGYKPQMTSAEDHFLVRIRQKGFEELAFFEPTFEEAENAADRIEAERRTGTFEDYRKGYETTLAKLMVKYFHHVCPEHKGREIEQYTLRAFVLDAGGDPALFEKPQAPGSALGPAKKIKKGKPRHIPRQKVQWLNKPFASLLPNDINQYKASRLAQGLKPATVDREIDLIAQVVNWAIDTERVPIKKSPMDGVIRPRYTNERSRRLRGDEEERLLAAAREEDVIRSRDIAVEARIASVRAEVARLSVSDSTRKRRIAAAKEAAAKELDGRFEHIALFETLTVFLLGTVCRLGEARALTWEHTHLDRCEAYFPRTKNGETRSAPLRDDVIALLKRLPRTDERVFPISRDTIEGAWDRICARAGIENLVRHNLRHEGCSQLTEVFRAVGKPLQVHELAQITGHKDLRMLARYTHLCAGEQAEQINAAFAEAKKLGKLRKGRVQISSLTSTPQAAAPAEQPLQEPAPARPPCSARRARVREPAPQAQSDAKGTPA